MHYEIRLNKINTKRVNCDVIHINDSTLLLQKCIERHVHSNINKRIDNPQIIQLNKTHMQFNKKKFQGIKAIYNTQNIWHCFNH